MQQPLKPRTAERVIRNSADLEGLALRLVAQGHEDFAKDLMGASKLLMKIGAKMMDRAEGRE